MTIIRVLKQLIRCWILKLAGYEELLKVVTVQKQTIRELRKQLGGIKCASYNTEFWFNPTTQRYEMNLFFYMPDDRMNEHFLESYSALILGQTEIYLQRFNEDFADVCRKEGQPNDAVES